MLNSSFFDCLHIAFEKCMSYVVCHMSYVTTLILEKRYKQVKKIKISFDVPSNQIFSKTVSSLFALKSINNYSNKMSRKSVFSGVSSFFFLKSGVDIRHTTYDIRHTTYDIHSFKMGFERSIL